MCVRSRVFVLVFVCVRVRVVECVFRVRTCVDSGEHCITELRQAREYA